jgi:hypothetical protein
LGSGILLLEEIVKYGIDKFNRENKESNFKAGQLYSFRDGMISINSLIGKKLHVNESKLDAKLNRYKKENYKLKSELFSIYGQLRDLENNSDFNL